MEPSVCSNHGQSNDRAYDEKTDHRHDAVEVPPPPGAGISGLVKDLELVAVIDVPEVAGASPLLLHLVFGVGG